MTTSGHVADTHGPTRKRASTQEVRHQKSSPMISAQEKTQSDVKGQENPGQAPGDRSANGEIIRCPFAKRIQVRHRVTDCISPMPSGIQKSRTRSVGLAGLPLDVKERATECIVFRTQQVSKAQCPSIGRPIAVYVDRSQ